MIPAQFQIIQNVRFQYGCRCGAKPKTSPLKPFILPRHQVSASFLSTVVVQKFEDATPLHSDLSTLFSTNWYLAIFDKNINNGFRFLRIGRIVDIDITTQTFQKNKDIEIHLKNFQSLFTYFKKPSFEVILKISKEVSKFFLYKKFLTSQRIIKTYEDGSLKVHYHINNEMEILLLVKKWLPDI